ncbi:hypothetical protein SLS63_010661 [Diaporthe eres]|uniref:Uncharacterized protein n=1 Tax=Diaporthe eres TaxID=83184 RepID=A0ABR1NW86_DIAER
MPGDNENGTSSCEEEAEEAEEEGDITYAAPSDLCQGVCLLYKADEGYWYANAFNKYFQEGFSPPFPKERPTTLKQSRLREVQSVEEMGLDEE